MMTSCFSFLVVQHFAAIGLRRLASIAAILLFLGVTASGALGAKVVWESPDPADLAATECKDFPGADVEILLATTKISEWSMGSTSENFIRAKIFTDRGKEQKGGFEIPYVNSYRPTGVAARVVKRSGKIVELQSTDIIETFIYKAGHYDAVKKLTIVFPDLEAGDIVEYRWTENRRQFSWMYNYCQSRYPTREYRFSVGEIAGKALIGCVNCPGAKLSTKGDATTEIVRNLPAFEEEDFMPAEKQYRGWIYVIKNIWGKDAEDEMWTFLSDAVAKDFRRLSKVNDDVTDKANSLVAGCRTDEERLRCLYQFVQEKIQNTTYNVTEELRAKIDHHKEQEPDRPSVVLRHGYGTAEEIDYLFAAMARAIGFDTRCVCHANTDELLNIKILRAWAFFDESCVGVKVGGRWQFYRPGNYFLPFGMIGLGAEGATGLICEPNAEKPEFAEIPASTAEQNQQTSAAHLVLNADGAIEGEVEQLFTGQFAVQRKQSCFEKSPEEIEKRFRQEIVSTMPGAEVTGMKWENLATNILPLKVTYHLRVPGYAQKAGSRLLFAPNFFSAGKPVVFTAAERKYPVFFRFPWIEEQAVDIVLPDGFVFDNPSAPAAVGDGSGILDASYKLRFSGKTNTFSCHRSYSLGAKGGCRFRKEGYPLLKDLFERLHQSDSHMIILKPKPVASTPSSS